MFRNYLKIAFRHLLLHKTITFINVAGLAIGMACCILIMLLVKDELSFDQFHTNKANIYRVTTKFTENGRVNYGTSSQFPTGPAMKAELSDVQEAVRVYEPGNTLFTHGDNKFLEEHAAFADADFFKMFSFPLVAGDVATALKEPNSIVITESAAKKYFGNQDPIGKTIRMANETDCKVTAVAKDMPLNTDIRYDLLISFSTFERDNRLAGLWMYFSQNFTYVALRDKASLANVNKTLAGFVDLHIGKIAKRLGMQFSYQLQPLGNIHLHPGGDEDKEDRSKLIYIYIVIAVFLVVIASINFMNLVTARASERALEVGLRKVMGAARRTLIMQFLLEAVLLSLLAFVIAVILAMILLPAFNSLTDKSLSLFGWQQLSLLGTLLLLAVFTGLLAGSYPALFLSGFMPIAILKGTFQSLRNRTLLRKVMVVSQFAIAIILIVSTVVVYSQLRYWREMNLGFDKEHLVNIYLSSTEDVSSKKELLKQELLRLPAVKNATMSNMALGRFIGSYNPVAKEGDSDDKSITPGIITGDFDLVKTLGLQIVKGRDFSADMATDSTDAFIINEAAAKKLGLHDPLGARIEWRPGPTPRKGAVIGVVKDFNFSTLQLPVDAVVYLVSPQGASVLTVRLQPGNLPAQMAQINKLWAKLIPNYPIQFSFPENDLSQQYLREYRLGSIFGVFAVLSIFIACMGLFGLSILISRQRTKEIGIRKVLGASVGNITALLSRDFLKLVFVAIVIASPLAWYLMNQWLQDFTYRIQVQWWMFLIAGLGAVVIAMCTIGFQSVKAALMNPVKSLKTE